MNAAGREAAHKGLLASLILRYHPQPSERDHCDHQVIRDPLDNVIAVAPTPVHREFSQPGRRA